MEILKIDVLKYLYENGNNSRLSVLRVMCGTRFEEIESWLSLHNIYKRIFGDDDLIVSKPNIEDLVERL